MDDMLKQLEKIKSSIEDAKTKRNQIEAETNFTLQKLKSDYECNTIEEAEELLIQLIDETDQLKLSIAKRFEELLKEAEIKGLI